MTAIIRNTKEIIKSSRSQGKGESSIINKQIDELTKEISKGVGLSGKKQASVNRPVAELSTISMDAYNCFLSGREQLYRYQFDEALNYLNNLLILS